MNKNKIFSFNLGLILSDKCLELSISCQWHKILNRKVEVLFFEIKKY